MIKNLTLLIFLTLTVFFTYSQETYNSANMLVSTADLENTIYKKDSTANAFFIYEKGFSRVQNGGDYNLLTDYEAKIKILNEKGFDRATVSVLLFKNKNGKEQLDDLKAYTYNLENGKIIKTKIEKKNIYTEAYDKNYTLVKFTFPNIKSGSVLTYKYQLESPFMYKFNGWNFQDDIPKIYSEYVADLPGNYIYNIKLIGTLKLETNTSTILKKCLEVSSGGHADCSHNVYIMKNIPAFKEEKYMTAKENYFSKIDYELKEFKGFNGTNKKYTETWENVDNKLKKEVTIGVQLKKLAITKGILPDSIEGMPNDINKAKKIFRYISTNYTWNKKNRIFKDGNINNVIKEKTGNVSGINILLHNTLKQQKFIVHPILLSTRDNGYATKIHPVISSFNYLIVQLTIDNKNYLLDATEKTLAFGEVPFRCLNQYGRLLDFKNGSSWIDIEPKQISAHFFKEEVILDEELKLNGRAKHLYSGYHSHFKRKKLEALGEGQFLNEIKNQNPEITVTDIHIKNKNNYDKAIEFEFDFTRDDVSEIDDILYLKPFTKSFFKQNPFKLNQRTYPIDFGYKDSYTYLVSIELPKSHEFIDIPKNSLYQIPNKLGQLGISFQKNAEKLIITYRITFNSSYYSTEYYPILKEFFNLIVSIENDILIGVKKKS